MKKLIFLLAFLFLGIINTHSEEKKDSLLWRISGNGLQCDSYLLGTMHNVGGSHLFKISGFRKVFFSVKQVAIERDFFTEDSISRATHYSLPAYQYMPKDTTYAMLYSPTDYHFVDSLLKKWNSRYDKYKPLFWCGGVQYIWTYQQINNGEQGMDRFLYLMSCQNNKKIYFMETLEEFDRRQQREDSISYSTADLKQQADMLLNLLCHKDTILVSIKAFNDEYKEKGLKAVIKKGALLKEGINNLKSDKVVYDNLVNYFNELGAVRNEKWMKNILPMITKDSSLIAVGAMHLIGENGLIAKLRKLGYTVKPVEY